MTSLNKKAKIKRTFLDRGGEKDDIKLKRYAMYHKRDRVKGKKEIRSNYELN